MWLKFRHRVVFAILHPFFTIYLKIKYGYRAYKYILPKGPCLILYNHPTNLDPFMLALSFWGPIYFMANEDLFNRPIFSPLIKYLVAPIPKSKAIRDIQAVKDCIKVTREGGRIAIAPEGNRNYSGRLNYIDPSIVKLIKLLQIPVVLYNIHGGFGVNPRFSKKLRKGKMFGRVNRVLSVEDIKQLNNEEILDIIVENLDVDDVKLNYEYKGHALAEHLESVFYICPICNSYNSLYSKRDYLYCSKCDLQVKYTSKLTFECNHKDFTFTTVNDYYLFQEKNIRLKNVQEISYHDNNIILKRVIKRKRKQKIMTGFLKVDHEKIEIENKLAKKIFLLTDIVSMAIVYHNTLIINLRDEQYHLVGDPEFNALKIMHLFYKLNNENKGVENGFLGI